MGYRRRFRSRTKCSAKAYRRAHDKGPQALVNYLKACGPLGGTQRRRRRQ